MQSPIKEVILSIKPRALLRCLSSSLPSQNSAASASFFMWRKIVSQWFNVAISDASWRIYTSEASSIRSFFCPYVRVSNSKAFDTRSEFSYRFKSRRIQVRSYSRFSVAKCCRSSCLSAYPLLTQEFTASVISCLVSDISFNSFISFLFGVNAD